MNPVPRSLPRRTVLAASGTAVLAVAAACSSDPGTAGSATAAATSAAKSSSAAASTGSAAASSKAAAPTTAGTSAAVPARSPVASVAEVEAAGSVVVGTDKPILLCSANGTVVGHTAICTHQGCTVAAAGADANCPCHGSKFNAATGAVITGPAMSALAEVAVTVANGQVYAT